MRHLLAAPWLTLLLASMHNPAQAIPIFVNNPGFEASPTTGVNVGLIPGWTTATGSGSGWWNINTLPLGFWSVPAPEGNQVAFVARTDPGGPASIAQTLGATLQPNAVYTLTGSVGHPIGFGSSLNPDTLYTVELLAGGNLLSLISGTGPEGRRFKSCHRYQIKQRLTDKIGKPFLFPDEPVGK